MWEVEKDCIEVIFGLYEPWWWRLLHIYFFPILLLVYIYILCIYIGCIAMIYYGAFPEVFKNWLGV
jgi:hypothetical protein